MTLILLVLLLTARSASPPVLVQPCLAYDPSVVVVTGKIKRHTFAGPPNYESVAKGDAAETTWLLHLAKPVCVSGGEAGEEEKRVSDLQLVFSEGEKQYQLYRPLVGRTVTATGTLFHAHTGHHHTKVLLTVRSIKKQ